MQNKEWFIPGNTPSLKNSKIKTSRGIFPSKTVMNYLKSLGIKSYSASRKTVDKYKLQVNLFQASLHDFPKELNYPVMLGFHFVRDTKRSFDFNNISQVILDLLTAHNFIEDDSAEYVIPQYYKKDDKWYSIDKENPGVYIKIINNG